MNENSNDQMPGPAGASGQKQPTTKPETKAPTADAADTHTRKRDEVQPPQNNFRSPKMENL